MKRQYVETAEGQVHLRIAGEPTDKPDLFCLHPAPFSGVAVETLMPLLAQDRRVIAPDLPGHGGSDPLHKPPSIEAFATAMSGAIQAISSNPVDILGFHTGCLVACEVSLQRPAQVRRLLLCDVPAFDPAQRAKLLAPKRTSPAYALELESISAEWKQTVVKRAGTEPASRSLAMFAEQFRQPEWRNSGFVAAFQYAIEYKLPQITHETAILASGSMLLDPTRRSHSFILTSKLIEFLDIKRSVLDEAASRTAGLILEEIE